MFYVLMHVFLTLLYIYMMKRHTITQRNIPICHAVTDRHIYIYTQYIFFGHLSGILLHGMLNTKKLGGNAYFAGHSFRSAYF